MVVEGDPGLLGGALRDLLANPAAADAMGRRGAKAARERFGWAAVAAQMEAVYLQVGLQVGPGEDAVKIAFVVERPTQFEVPFYRMRRPTARTTCG